MKKAIVIWMTVAACVMSGCAHVGTRAGDDHDSEAVLAVPERFLAKSAEPIGWSYWNVKSLQRRIEITLSGVTIYDNVVGATPWNPRCFTDTRLKPGSYTVIVRDRESGEEADITFEAEETRHISIELAPLEIHALDHEPNFI